MAEASTRAQAPTVTKVAPTVGTILGGDNVTITGSKFTGVTAVAFGTASATGFTFVSDVSITAITPAQDAGTVHVMVTTPSGTNVTTQGDQYEYGAHYTATNPDGTICQYGPNVRIERNSTAMDDGTFMWSVYALVPVTDGIHPMEGIDQTTVTSVWVPQGQGNQDDASTLAENLSGIS